MGEATSGMFSGWKRLGQSTGTVIPQTDYPLTADLVYILRCPHCQSPIADSEKLLKAEKPALIFCANSECYHSVFGFPVINGQPILIDFSSSLFDRDEIVRKKGGASIKRDNARTDVRTRLRAVLFGKNRVAEKCCERFLNLARSIAEQPRILVIGGGGLGWGTGHLYTSQDIVLVGTDVYISRYTRLAADGHALPFASETFDGVWVQAVLEHVLDPARVVEEIYRVLRSNGVVYAETPFMQQVHEGAYDFTRFTLSGHRWLFRRFEHKDSGAVSGAGTALVWAIRYFIRALTGSGKVATGATILFFWLRFFDRVMKPVMDQDAASGVFFLGTKSAHPITPKQIVEYFNGRGSTLTPAHPSRTW